MSRISTRGTRMLRETQSLELGLSEVLLLDMSEAWANTNQSACLGPARWSWVSSQHSSLRMVWFLPWKLRANIERPWKIRSNSTWHELYLGVGLCCADDTVHAESQTSLVLCPWSHSTLLSESTGEIPESFISVNLLNPGPGLVEWTWPENDLLGERGNQWM